MEFVPQHASSWHLVGSISNWLYNHDNDHNGWDPLTNRAIPGWSSQMSLTHQLMQLINWYCALKSSMPLLSSLPGISRVRYGYAQISRRVLVQQGCSFTNLSAFWAIGTIDVLVRLVNETRRIREWMMANGLEWSWYMICMRRQAGLVLQRCRTSLILPVLPAARPQKDQMLLLYWP